jgi:thiamine kinase-like enzyme
MRKASSVLPEAQNSHPLEPPADVPEIQQGNWFTLPASDIVVEYLSANIWQPSESPAAWEVARLSSAAYIYREKATQWAALAKFYAVKTGPDAEKHARREFECTQKARASCLAEGSTRVVQPLGVWRGVLFLEYVDGLTLEDIIAVRRNRPGTLTPSLERAAECLATLHAHGIELQEKPDFETAIAYARKLIDNLSTYGVLQGEPVIRDGLLRAVDRWARQPAMQDFVPAFIHGDATTSNFVFRWGDGLVVIDWERFKVADPAADLGRLMAEVSHSVSQQGGDTIEAWPLIERLADAYRRALPSDWDADALRERARFYQASSTLRIARNGWLSRLDRTALVAQALALLT